MVAQNIAFDVIAAVDDRRRAPRRHHQERRARRAVARGRARRCRPAVHPAAAEFVAVTQVLVYIGAIVVLFLFGIMLTRAPIGRDDDLDHEQLADRRPSVASCSPACMAYALIDAFGDRHRVRPTDQPCSAPRRSATRSSRPT